MEKQIVALAMGISIIYFIDGLAEIISKKKDAEYKFYYVAYYTTWTWRKLCLWNQH